MVTLHTEGVDRNSRHHRRAKGSGLMSPSTRRVWIEIITLSTGLKNCLVTLHTEGVDRNTATGDIVANLFGSPSTRRVWIEIVLNY